VEDVVAERERARPEDGWMEAEYERVELKHGALADACPDAAGAVGGLGRGAAVSAGENTGKKRANPRI